MEECWFTVVVGAMLASRDGVHWPATGAGTLGRMVVSFFVAPGAEVKNVAGLTTIWSMEMPSSRRWTRIRCVPDVAK